MLCLSSSLIRRQVGGAIYRLTMLTSVFELAFQFTQSNPVSIDRAQTCQRTRQD